MNITGNKTLYRAMLAMAWPIMIEEGLQTAVSYVDAAMVGQLGAWASAAVGITQTANWLIWGLLRAASIGLIAYVAQAMGAQDYRRTRRAGSQAMLLAAIMGIVVGGLSLAVAFDLPRWMGAEADIQSTAGQYFFILCLPMIFRSATINLGAVIRATGDMRTPMLVNLVVNVVHILLNLVLIYPTRTISIFGTPLEVWGAGLEVQGAAISAAVSVAMGGVLMLIALYRNPYVSPRGGSYKPDREVLRYNAKIALPAGLQHVVVCSGFLVFVALVARLGTTSLAAHTIANTAEQAFYIPAYGLQGVAATMIGMAIGEGNESKADSLVKMLNRVALISMAALGALLFIFPEALMGVFTNDAEVIRQGVIALRIVAVAEPFFGVLTVAEGVLRGAGNLKPTLYVSLGCMWGIRILFTWLCLNFWGMGLTAVWACMTADNIGRYICYTWLLRTGRWKKTVEFGRAEASAS